MDDKICWIIGEAPCEDGSVRPVIQITFGAQGTIAIWFTTFDNMAAILGQMANDAKVAQDLRIKSLLSA